MAKKIKRLINITALIEAINDELYMDESTKAAFRSIVYQQPLIDAVPVVHGRWEWIEDSTNNCSACGHTTFFYPCLETVPNYCKNCGAKMDGGVSDA